MAPGRLSLAEQIAQLEDAVPVDFDPEDVQARGMDVDEDTPNGDSAVAREHYLEVGPSTLRKQHDSISDPKYDGVRTSRKQLMENGFDAPVSQEDEDEINGHREWESGDEDAARNEDDEDEDDEEGADGAGPSQPSESSDEDEEGEEEEENDGESDEEEEGKDEIRSSKTQKSDDNTEQDDLTSTLQKAREQERKKGKAVSRQIAIWDSLLDARIQLQKCATNANRLPPPSEMSKYLQNAECRESIVQMLDQSLAFVDELFELQETLLSKNDTIGVTPPPRKRRRTDTTDDITQYESDLKEASESSNALEAAFHPYLLQTLNKWSSKIQAVAPSVLLPSNRGAFSKGAQQTKSAVQLIDETLASEHSKLVAKTQVRRGKGNRIGELEKTDEDDESKEDPEIFDDTDFYQKMLRDIIDARNGASGEQDWMVLQKQKKAKKKVDTKASKGRKIRYDVHEKLQNFMVPVPVPGAWHEEQIDELFASLLGKGFEASGVNNEPEEVAAQEIDVRDALQSGFRVFG